MSFDKAVLLRTEGSAERQKQVEEFGTKCLTGGAAHSALLWNVGLWSTRKRKSKKKKVCQRQVG